MWGGHGKGQRVGRTWGGLPGGPGGGGGGGCWEPRGSVLGGVMSARRWVFLLPGAVGGMEMGSMEVGELRGHKANAGGGSLSHPQAVSVVTPGVGENLAN